MRYITMLLTLACALVALHAPATSMAGEGPPESQGWRPSVKAEVHSGFIAGAEMDDGGGDVTIWKNEARVKVSPLTLRYEIRSYGWDDTHRLPLVENDATPWDSLHRVSIGLSHQDQFNDTWGWFAGAVGTSAFEQELDGSFGGAFRAGLSYSFSRQWQVMAGGSLMVNAIRVRAFPVLGVVYNGIGDDGTGFLARITAPDASLLYQFTRSFGISGSFGFDSRFYRLADDSPVQEKGYLASRSLETSLLAEWSPAPGLDITFGPTFAFAREMTIYRDNGDKVRAPDVDSALGAAGSISYRF